MCILRGLHPSARANPCALAGVSVPLAMCPLCMCALSHLALCFWQGAAMAFDFKCTVWHALWESCAIPTRQGVSNCARGPARWLPTHSAVPSNCMPSRVCAVRPAAGCSVHACFSAAFHTMQNLGNIMQTWAMSTLASPPSLQTMSHTHSCHHSATVHLGFCCC